MSAPMAELDLNELIEYCATLSAAENFLLIGALARRQYSSIEVLRSEPLNTEDNWRAAVDWTRRHFRTGMAYFCERYKTEPVTIGTEFIKQAVAFAKNVVTPLALILNSSKYAAVAFVFWLIFHKLDKWCILYAKKRFTGEGSFTPSESSEAIPAFFDIEYLPPVVEIVEDERAYPLIIPSREVRLPAETTGKMRVPDQRAVDSIVFAFEPKASNRAVFRDSDSNVTVETQLTNVYPARDFGANVVGIAAHDLELTPEAARPN